MNIKNRTNHHTIANLDSISRKGDVYTARYEWEEEYTVQFANKVYTNNIGMNGKLGVSKVYNKLHPVTKSRTVVDLVEITKDEAVILVSLARLHGVLRILGSRKNWVAYIM